MKNNPKNYLVGTVASFFEEKRFGFLKGEDGKQRFFRISDVKDRIILERGTRVRFVSEEAEKEGLHDRARKIQILEKKQVIDNTSLFKSITTEWMLEATHENTLRYFYHLDEFKQIENGTKCFVIGRKGTGKTALSEYLYNQKSYNTYTERLSFKNFPFNKIYSLVDHKFTFPNQYITIWKFIIYDAILKMMSLNEELDTKLLSELRKLYPIDPIDSLSKRVYKLTYDNIKIKLPGIEVGISKKKENQEELSWIKKVNEFEQIIANKIDKSRYVIIFDALDDDYKTDDDYTGSDGKKQYFALLTGLFKAVQDIKANLSRDQYKIQPIVFLRDDIYRQIHDSDKTKWEDFTIHLIWSKNKIKNMLAHRISKTIDKNGEVLSFEGAWHRLFPFEYIETQFGNKLVFDYIAQHTYSRPRDFVQFIKLCCSRALRNNAKEINSVNVVDSIKEFSNCLREEIQNEMRGILKDIDRIMTVLAHIRKSIFNSAEFIERYNEEAGKGKITHAVNPEMVLETLFLFDVIGNHPKNEKPIFYRSNPLAKLNLEENLVVAQGLRRSLQIT